MRPKKHLGQHFLTAPTYARRIAEAVPAASGDPVLEIGPGKGALSAHLVARFPALHLVEIDQDVVQALSDKLGPGHWTLHRQDALTFDYTSVGAPLHVVGNLPYSAGGRLIHNVLNCGNRIASCTFMVQKEVARRICAGPHTKENGYLSIFCQFFGTPRLLFNVPPGAFFPPPAVDSSVFQIVVDHDLEGRLPHAQWQRFFGMVDKAFQQRRKKLTNALGDAEGVVVTEEMVVALGLPGTARPEDLTAGQWLQLFAGAIRA